MTRRLFVLLCSMTALLLTAGCGGGNTVTADETTDPVYQQAQDLKKQGRNGEALTAFLRVIERRGESGAPESHLEAGNLYLNWSKDPIEAYHHFSKYLELQPNGQRADFVRGQREAAKREIAKMLFAPPGDQGASPGTADELQELRRKVAELEAENQTLRGNTDLPVSRPAPAITLSTPALVEAAPVDSPITPAPRPPPSPGFAHSLEPAATEPRPAAARPKERTAVSGSRPPAPSRVSGARRTHVVAARESLWAIARRYYGSNVSGAQVHGIYEANRDVMTSPTDLRAGMVLRIP
ncbi:MAG TPA: LysM peptidoglycan-binding domain-containing protein [Opitutaceae bacterium]|nr:LysM peptidoglycan-binding domain-containing protein [Opitutaceae bacterium]